MKNSNFNTELDMLFSTHQGKCFTRTKRVYDKGVLAANDKDYYNKKFLEALKFRTVFMIEVDEFKKYVINDFNRNHKLGKPVHVALRIIEKYRMTEDRSSVGAVTFEESYSTGTDQVFGVPQKPVVTWVEDEPDQEDSKENTMDRKQMVELFAEWDARRKVMAYIESWRAEPENEKIPESIIDNEVKSVETGIKEEVANRQVVVMTQEELSEAIRSNVEEALEDYSPAQKPKEESDGIFIEDAMEITGLSRQAIYGRTSKKTIPHCKQGGLLHFKRSELLAWIESGRRKSSSRRQYKLDL